MFTLLKVALGIVLGAVALATFPASAEPVRYVSISLLSSSHTADLSGGQYTYEHSFDGEADFAASPGGAIALGWERAGGFRFEGELGLSGTDTDRFDGTFHFGAKRGYPLLFRAVPMPVALNTLTLMGNVYYVHGSGWFKPYVGAGAGLAHHRINADLRGGPFGIFVRAKDSAIAFAWQAMVGVAADLTPHSELRLGYRWLRSNPSFDSVLDDADEIGTGPLDVGFAKNSVQIGLIVKF